MNLASLLVAAKREMGQPVDETLEVADEIACNSRLEH
jgi:hypothetical protein